MAIIIRIPLLIAWNALASLVGRVAGDDRSGIKQWFLSRLDGAGGYTAALMALNQIAPPLLLLALPGLIRAGRLSRGKACGVIDFLLDPWAATILFIGLSIAVSLPGVFDRSVANALYATPLGVLELGAGLLVWAQFMPTTRSIRTGWLAGTLAWTGAMPMTVIAVVWMLSPDVLQ